MAAIDYNIRSVLNQMCPNAMLEGVMALAGGPTATAIFRMQHVSNMVSNPDVRIGQGVMIQDEIMRIEAFTDTSLILARGCADTIPQAHTDGAMIWFFDGWMGTDNQEYISGETIGVKALPTTVGGTSVPVDGVPPTQLIFNSRQVRPYAPGNMKANGDIWTTSHDITLAAPTLTLTWAHRDRKTQHDILVAHHEAGTGLEAGSSYTIRALSTTGTERAAYTGVTDETWAYTLAQAQTDYGITPGTGPAFVEGIIELKTVRDGFDSWSIYRIPFRVSNEVTP
jgi:hypothetical protein